MEKKIITISREYGSGGRQIGLTAAKKLGMEFYDKELIDAAAKEIGFPAEIIADREQRLTNSHPSFLPCRRMRWCTPGKKLLHRVCQADTEGFRDSYTCLRQISFQ